MHPDDDLVKFRKDINRKSDLKEQEFLAKQIVIQLKKLNRFGGDIYRMQEGLYYCLNNFEELWNSTASNEWDMTSLKTKL
jgi:hypothetical protein